MTGDAILIPIRYIVCRDGVEFDLSTLLELKNLQRAVETALGTRLVPVELTGGYVRYRYTGTRGIGDSADRTDASVSHPPSVDLDRSDPAHGELASTNDPSGYCEDGEGGHLPQSGGQAPTRPLTAGDGRPVLLGDRPFVVPVSTPTAAVPREAGAGWTDLVVTGEACYECHVSTMHTFLLGTDQLPADATVGDELEFHGVRKESVTIADIPVSPQLDLDLGGVSEASGAD